MSRIVVFISFFVLCNAGRAVAQIACPAMAITQVNVSKSQRLSGFSSAVRNGRKSTRMGDFFTAKKHSGSGFSGKDPFSFKTKKSGARKEYSEFRSTSSRRNLFRDYDEFAGKGRGRGSFFDKDEFASRIRKKGRFRSYDEFATRSKRSGQFRDFDEFAYSRKTRRVNIDSQFAVGSTEKRFNRSKNQKDEFNSKKKRAKQTRNEYTPFASSSSPFAGEKQHREPQMGLWGGTVGNRSGKDSRPTTPLPDSTKKKAD
ncbi:MAG: hypothetical protein K9G41_03970 [Flavobacteriales bacterium]|nr:hypothetical protein [Flavobacteriales bacterium]